MKLSNNAIAILIATIGVSGPAFAVQQIRANFQTAVNNCQAALPSFEGAFRKRPLGIVNEGGSAAFLSCGSSVELIGSTGVSNMTVFFFNATAVAVNVACTLSDDITVPAEGSTTFITKTFLVPSGATQFGTWFPHDNGGNGFRAPSISCAIPPGVEIKGTEILYDTDVGP